MRWLRKVIALFFVLVIIMPCELLAFLVDWSTHYELSNIMDRLDLWMRVPRWPGDKDDDQFPPRFS